MGVQKNFLRNKNVFFLQEIISLAGSKPDIKRCLEDTSISQYVYATVQPSHVVLATFCPMRQFTTAATFRPKMDVLSVHPKSGWFVACQRFDH
jgi:hypothetical protein